LLTSCSGGGRLSTTTATTESRLMLTAIDVHEVVDYCQLVLTKVTARQ